ncbi:acyltransferase family protein [Aurantimonas manganoxydans]|nr:acyltransferase [Aurantimonas manganoxydans]
MQRRSPTSSACASVHPESWRCEAAMSKLATLQVLRGLAAVTVVVDHAILRQAEWSQTSKTVVRAAEYSGALAVAVFFVISGFIMLHTSARSYGAPGAVRVFLVKRLWRIVPLYWIATSLELVLRLRAGAEVTLDRVLAAYLFVPYPVAQGEYMRPLLGVGWTLNYEMFFYLLFAASLALPIRRGLPLLFAALLSIVALGAFFITPLNDVSPPHTILNFLSEPIILLFPAGMLVALLNKSGWLPVIPGALAIILLLLGENLLGFSLFVDRTPAPFVWWGATWVVCAIAIGLSVAAREAQRPTPVLRSGVWLGDVSYALYLFHFFTIVAAEKIWWSLFGVAHSQIAFVAFATAASIAAAGVIHLAVEQPIMRLLRGRSVASRPIPQTALASLMRNSGGS